MLEELLAWYGENGRDLPWRRTRDPYAILVSEVMLQQTQVERVVPRYLAWLERWPTVQALGGAPVGEVIREWQGLGYNRRALNLKRLAEDVVRDHGGELPQEVPELERLPGIGKYTAHAVACFAFGAQVPVVDTNIRRILSSFAGRELSDRETWELAARMLPPGRASDWNQALMDYGALVHRAVPRRTGKKPEAFATTNRFWRGRIIDALRERGRISVDGLLEALTYPNRDEARVRGLVRALHEEGMLSYDAGEDSVDLPR
jgi:A/G-specific adenine glycosylase